MSQVYHKKAKVAKGVQATAEGFPPLASTSSITTTTLTTPAHPGALPHPQGPRVKTSNLGTSSHKTQKQQKQQKLEELCNGYKLLEGDQGLVIEDEKGVPLLIVVRNILPQDHNVGTLNIPLHFFECSFYFQEALTAADSEFTKKFKPTKKSKFRDEFKLPKDSPFQAMAAHFALWWQIGHPVSFLSPLL